MLFQRCVGTINISNLSVIKYTYRFLFKKKTTSFLLIINFVNMLPQYIYKEKTIKYYIFHIYFYV